MQPKNYFHYILYVHLLVCVDLEKKHAMVNLEKRYLDDAWFTRVFIILPTYESNPIFHVLKIADEDVYSNLHTSIQNIADILKNVKKIQMIMMIIMII